MKMMKPRKAILVLERRSAFLEDRVALRIASGKAPTEPSSPDPNGYDRQELAAIAVALEALRALTP